jgi:hypothetical protein
MDAGPLNFNSLTLVRLLAHAMAEPKLSLCTYFHTAVSKII